MNTTGQVTSLPSRHPLAQGIALAMALSMGSVQAAVFTVTTDADSGPGSLRQAVFDADATPGADQITFDDGLSTIGLTSGQIDITETLTITGPATGQTIDAGGNSRVLAVTVADQSLTLENLTVTGGITRANGVFETTCGDDTGEGGGICAPGDVTLINSTVSGNSTAGDSADGGGLFVRNGSATLTNSTVSGNSTAGQFANGGGLHVYAADATLTNSTVSGNSTAGLNAGGGGLAAVYGNATLTNSTVTSNTTTGGGVSGGGGGVFVRNRNATLTNSTVSGNSTAGQFASGGGFYVVGGNATLTNSTVTANQSGDGAGGISVDSGLVFGSDRTLTMFNTLLAANRGPGGNFDADSEDGGSVTLNASNSLFGDRRAEVNGIDRENVFTDTPDLNPLADNGCTVSAGAPGSAACVQTHALMMDSAAIDVADDTVCADEPVNNLDQRGEMRPADGDSDDIANCDIGAFERQVATTPIDYDITGSWYNPATNGQGFSIEVVPAGDVLAAYWFTYSVDGSAQMWLQGAGEIDVDSAQVPLQELTGGEFVDPTPPTRSDWGTVRVRFFSDSSGEAIYDSDVDDVDGVIPLQRITPPIACSEADAPPAETIDARFTGSWYDPTNDGQGFSLEVIPERNLLVVYWFTYTVEGPAQMWLQGSGPITGDTATVELARPVGGQFDEDRVPTRPVWGTMTIGFDSSTGGEVSYDSPLDGVSGTFPIQRITPQAFCE